MKAGCLEVTPHVGQEDTAGVRRIELLVNRCQIVTLEY